MTFGDKKEFLSLITVGPSMTTNTPSESFSDWIGGIRYLYEDTFNCLFYYLVKLI